MKTRSLAVGSFVVVALLMATLLITSLGKGRWFGGGQTRAVVWFDKSVKGLSVGAPVTFRGVPIGQVETIEVVLDPSTLRSRMPVTLTLTTDAMSLKAKGTQAQRLALQQLIDRGLVAQMVNQSLVTGQSMIDLNIVPAKAQTVQQSEDGPLQIPQLGGAFDQLLDQVSDLPLKDTVAEFRAALVSMRELSDQARQTMVLVQKDVGRVSAQAIAATQGVSGDFHQVATDASSTLKSVRGFADEGQALVAQARPEITLAARSINEAATDVRTGMGALSEWVAPGSPMRINLDDALKDLARSARSFTSFVEDIEEQPNALIFGRSHDR